MDTFILLFKSCRAWLGRCLGLLVGVLLMTQYAWAQIYSTTVINQYSGEFNYMDLSTQTWTNKTALPEVISSIVAYQGKLYGEAGYSNKFYEYDPVANTWTQKALKESQTTTYYYGKMVVAGDYIYYVVNNGAPSIQIKALKYSIKNNTWTQLPSAPSTILPTTLAYDGGNYIYCSTSNYGATPGPLLRYNISTDSWVTMPTPTTPTDMVLYGLVFIGGKMYITEGFGTRFYSYNPTTNTYTNLGNSPVGIAQLVSDGGNYLYGISSNGVYKYDISTNTWTNFSTTMKNGSLAYLAPPCSVTGTAAATPATCATSGGANANAVLTLTAHSGGATKVGYSAGSSYSGPAFASATAVTAAPMVLSNTLTNPTVPQPYTIRLFQDATCYKDVVATLAPTLCLTSDLSLSLSPAVQSGSKGELLTYTLMLTNAGPDAAANVKIDTKIPSNATLLTASPQIGTYSEATRKWEIGSLPVGSKTLTVTLKMN